MNLMNSKYYTAIYCVVSAFLMTFLGSTFSMALFIFLFVGGYFVLLGYSNTAGVTTIGVLAYFAMVYYPLGYYPALLCTMVIALPMAAAGYTLQKTIKDVKSQAPFFVGMILTAVFAYLAFKIYCLLNNHGVKELIDTIVTEIIKASKLEDMPMPNYISTLSTEEVRQLEQNVKIMVPSLFIIISTIIAVINQYIGMSLICRAGQIKLKNTPKAFRYFGYPKSFIYLSALTLGLAASLRVSTNGFVSAISLNAIIVFVYLLALQGLAIMVFNLQNVHIIVRIIIFTAMMLFASVSVNVLAFLGGLDVLADWRGLYRRG